MKALLFRHGVSFVAVDNLFSRCRDIFTRSTFDRVSEIDRKCQKSPVQGNILPLCKILPFSRSLSFSLVFSLPYLSCCRQLCFNKVCVCNSAMWCNDSTFDDDFSSILSLTASPFLPFTRSVNTSTRISRLCTVDNPAQFSPSVK